jgi:hypothetical protein
VKELHCDMYESLKIETEEEIRKWQYLPCSCIDRINIIKIAVLPKAIITLNAIHIQIPVTFLNEIEEAILTFT